MNIVDLEVGPYSSPAEIRAEIERVEATPKTEERADALNTLYAWLRHAENPDDGA